MYKQQTSQFRSRRTTMQNTSWSRNQNMVAFTSNVKIGPIMYLALVTIFVVLAGLVYLSQVAQTTGYDYRTRKLNEDISKLTNKKGDLEVENARLTSLKEVKDSSVAKNMSTPSNVSYVSN